MWRRPVRPMCLFVVELSCVTPQSSQILSHRRGNPDLAWIQLARDQVQWRDTLNTAVNLCIAWKESYFLASWATVSFSIKQFDYLIPAIHIVVLSVGSRATEAVQSHVSCRPRKHLKPERDSRSCLQTSCNCRCNCYQASLLVQKRIISPALLLLRRRE
jgi:CDP-diacylglycerol pyrophosphatase